MHDMFKTNPNCELDPKSAEIVQEMLNRLNKNSTDMQRHTRRNATKIENNDYNCRMAYLSGAQDAAHALLTALGLNIRDEHQVYSDDEFLDEETSRGLFAGLPHIWN